MPYKTYQTDPAWAQGANNLASALFPDPAAQIEMRNTALSGRKTEQEIRAQHRELNLADMLMNASRSGNFDEMYALGAGMSPQHMTAMPDFALGRATTPGTETSDDDLHRMLVGAGNMPNPDTSVSIGRQDAVSARNAGEEMDAAVALEEIKQAGQDRRYEPESTAAMRNSLWRVEQRMRNNPGMTEQHAWGLELNDINDRMDDLGNLSLVDNAQGTAERIEVQGLERPEPYSIPPAPSEEDLAFDPGEGTGFVASSLGLWNNTIGQLSPDWTAIGPEQAAQRTDALRLNVMSALRSTTRPLSIEMNLVNSLLPDTMAWTQNPQVAREQQAQVLDLVGQQYLEDMQIANDPTRGRDERGDHGARAAQLLRAMTLGLQGHVVDRYTEAAGEAPVPRRDSNPLQSGPAGPQVPVEQSQDQPQTYVNPETGERIMWDGQQWVPVP